MALPTTSRTTSHYRSFTTLRSTCSGPEPGYPRTNDVLLSQRMFKPGYVSGKASASNPAFRWNNLSYEIFQSYGNGMTESYGSCVDFVTGREYKITINRVAITAMGVGRGWPGWFTLPNWSGEMNQELASKTLSRLRQLRTTFDVGVTVGEGRETLDFIRAKGKALMGAYKAVRRGHIADAIASLTDGWITSNDGVPTHVIQRRTRRSTRGAQSPETVVVKRPIPREVREKMLKAQRVRSQKDAANNWMQIQFAWRPLIDDIKNFISYMAFRELNRVEGQTHRVSASSKRQVELVSGGVVSPTLYRMSVRRKRTYLVTLKNKAAIVNQIDELGLLNPLSVAWNLTSLSWMADWFVNIGQFLDSLSEFAAWEVVSGIESSRTQYYLSEVMAYSSGTSMASGYRKDIWTRYARSVGAPLPTYVPLSFSSPSNLKLGQWTTFVALARQTFK